MNSDGIFQRLKLGAKHVPAIQFQDDFNTHQWLDKNRMRSNAGTIDNQVVLCS